MDAQGRVPSKASVPGLPLAKDGTMFTLTILSFGCSATSALPILGDKSFFAIQAPKVSISLFVEVR